MHSDVMKEMDAVAINNSIVVFHQLSLKCVGQLFYDWVG